MHLQRYSAQLIACVLCACSAPAPAPAPTPAPAPAPAPAPETADRQTQLDELLAPVFVQKRIVGLSIALIENGEVATYHYGTLEAFGEQTTSDETIYEIGSATKLFTALLAADAAERDVIGLAKIVDDRLPGITFAHLASHVAGLPRLPGNLAPANPADPYADYDAARMESWLKTATPMRPPGTYLYSNLSAGLLGYAVSRAMKVSYGEAIASRVTGPLGMKDTSMTVSDANRSRFAAGHDAEGKEVAHWSFDALAGAGALRSTIVDMAAFVRANLDPSRVGDPSLRAAIVASHAPRHAAGEGGQRIGLGWHIAGSGWLWHNGQTGGFYSFTAFEPTKKLGLVVLANTSTPDVERIAVSLMQLLLGAP